MYKILFAGYSAQNRTKLSGYEHIVDLKDSEIETHYLDAAKLPFGFIPTGKRGKRLNLWFLEFTLHFIAPKYDLVHNFYPDNQMILKFKQKHKRHEKTVATTHLNYNDFSEHQINVLQSYDAVIVLNSAEVNFLRNRGVKAVFIPHGFYKPVFEINHEILKPYYDKINICFCGICYRDYKTLSIFADLIKGKNDIVLHLLGQPKTIKSEFSRKPNVVVHDFLSDNDYYSIFSQCDYSFLPLTFATANNTLLEAQFLGIPTILRAMDGINDYASKNDNIFFESKNDLENIINNMKKENQKQSLIDYAQKFEWTSIFKTTANLYKKILHGEEI